MGVSRDTSGDEMARALDAYSRTQYAARERAKSMLWEDRNRIRDALERLLRIAKLHSQNHRLPLRERQMTDDAQQAAIVMLARLDDFEASAKRNDPDPNTTENDSRSGG